MVKKKKTGNTDCNLLLERMFKQWCSAISLISTKQTTWYHLKSLYTKKKTATHVLTVFALILFTYSTCPKAKFRRRKKIYSTKFLHNFHLSESSFTCPRLRASGLVRRLYWLYFEHMYTKHIMQNVIVCNFLF